MEPASVSPQSTLTKERLSLSVSGTEIKLSAHYQPGEHPPLVFLHGFGSTKEDYADVATRCWNTIASNWPTLTPLGPG
jgi:pimeloyl-ACP methyl ester carboxylesterase